MTVEQALEVLRVAGWAVRVDREVGQLADTEPPLLMVACGYDPANRAFTRTVAQQSWTPQEDQP